MPSSGAARANRVIDEWNFISSIEPKISRAVLPSPSSVSRAHSLSLGPRIGGEIGFRLVQRGDREADRHRALSGARDLGKDEPHPVALLPPDLELPTNLVVDKRLCVHEAFEVERVRYMRLLSYFPQRSAQFPLHAAFGSTRPL